MDLNLGRPIGFSSLAKPIGALCNLKCTYCYYLEKLHLFPNHNGFKMNNQVLEAYIKQYIESQQLPEVTFVWQGGEPSLLGINFFKQIIQLQQKYAGSKTIHNSFQTNGTLLNDDWAQFFHDHQVLVGISIDGPERVHNEYRVYANNQPTFNHVMKNIERLHKYKVDFNTLSVVHRRNAQQASSIYHFLKQIGSGFIQFIPIVERETTKEFSELRLVHNKDSAARVTSWSVIPEQFGDFLIQVFNEWVLKDVGQTFVQMFDVTLANWVGENPYLCEFSPTCGNAVVVEHTGDVYSCDHFVYPEYYLGNILEKPLYALVSEKRQLEFGYEKLNSLPGQCKSCSYKFACHGGCLKNRFAYTRDNEHGLNYLCPGYKKFFAHVEPYMQFMKAQLLAQQPPSNVMIWAREQLKLQFAK